MILISSFFIMNEFGRKNYLFNGSILLKTDEIEINFYF